MVAVLKWRYASIATGTYASGRSMTASRAVNAARPKQLLELKAAGEKRSIRTDKRTLVPLGGTGMHCVHDPLLACARFCVGTWFIYDSVSYKSDDWRHPIVSIETSILSGLVVPRRKILLWRSRGAAINSTRLQLSDLDDTEHADGAEHDHNMMTIALLSAAEDCIFDKRSEHTEYLHTHHKAFRDQK